MRRGVFELTASCRTPQPGSPRGGARCQRPWARTLPRMAGSPIQRIRRPLRLACQPPSGIGTFGPELWAGEEGGKAPDETVNATIKEYRRPSTWATGDRLAVSVENNRMIASAINVDRRGFWERPAA
jgi:hypothetical protein